MTGRGSASRRSGAGAAGNRGRWMAGVALVALVLATTGCAPRVAVATAGGDAAPAMARADGGPSPTGRSTPTDRSTATDEPIVLGMLVPLTGGSAAVGAAMADGARLAVREQNAAGGVLGRQLVLHAHDDACDAQTAVAAANALVTEGVHGSVGGYCSGATLPTIAVFEQAGLPMVVPAANASDLSGREVAFLINGTGMQQAQTALDWMEEHRTTRVALVDDDSSYSRDITELTARALDRSPATELALHQVITPGIGDYADAVARILDAAPDVVYFTGYAEEGGTIIRQLRGAGYAGALMVADGSVDAHLVEVAGAAADGVRATMTQTPATIPGSAEWIGRYRTAFGSEPGPFSTQSYDAVRVMAHAIEEAGTTDGAAVVSALGGISGFPTFSGPLVFDAEHTLTGTPFHVLVVRDGEFVREPRERR